MAFNKSLELVEDFLKVNAGETTVVSLKVKNNETTIQSYKLRSYGFRPAKVSLAPRRFSLGPGQETSINLEVKIPNWATPGNYAGSLRLNGSNQPATVDEVTLGLQVGPSATPPTPFNWQPWLAIIGGSGLLGILAMGLLWLFSGFPSSPQPGPTMGAKCSSPASLVPSLFSDNKTTAIRLSQPDLSNLKVLRTEPADILPGIFDPLLSLSANSQRLAYVTASNETLEAAHLYYLEVNNPATPVQLAYIPDGLWAVQPAWSPDGRRLAFIQLNSALASQGATQLELWVTEVGGQPPRKITLANNQINPEIFQNNPDVPLCWASDNSTLIFTNDKGLQPAPPSAKPATQTEVNVDTGKVTVTTRPLQPAAPPKDDVVPLSSAQTQTNSACTLFPLSQQDPRWKKFVMRRGGDQIGPSGCALTSATMIFNYYGVPIYPDQLNNCLGLGADPLEWDQAARCTSNKVQFEARFDFRWQLLDQELAKGSPVIVGMTGGPAGMHFVVVTGKTKDANYTVTDPWDATSNKTLRYFSNRGYNMTWLVVYKGDQKICNRLDETSSSVGVAGISDGAAYKNSVTLGELTGDTSSVKDVTLTNIAPGNSNPDQASATSPVVSGTTASVSPPAGPITTTTPASLSPIPNPTTITTPAAGTAGISPVAVPSPPAQPILPGSYDRFCNLADRCYTNLINFPLIYFPYHSGLQLNEEGIYQVLINGKGQAGLLNRLKFTIDHTPPRVCVDVLNGAASRCSGTGITLSASGQGEQTLELAATADQGAAPSVQPARLLILADDNLSGVASIEYQLDGGSWNLYSNDTSFKQQLVVNLPGSHHLTVRATDVAGNVSELDSINFSVAGQLPGLTPAPTPVPPTPTPPTPTPVPPNPPSGNPPKIPPLPVVTVPDVVGKTQEEATKILKAQGLTVSVKEAVSDKVAKGLVVRQSVAGGTGVNLPTHIELIVSSGSDYVDVPNVVGLSKEVARTTLEKSGLQMNISEFAYSPTISKDVVISQSVASTGREPRNSTINVQISLGPELQVVTVPDVVGKTQEEATKILEAQGVTVTIKKVPDYTVAENRVVSQSVAGGTRVTLPAQIDLVISSGYGP